MSLKAIAWAWEAETESASEKLVLLALADCHNSETGQCWPGRDHIRKKTHLNIKTISRAICELERKGFIGVARKVGGGNTYHLRTQVTVSRDATGARCAYCMTAPIECSDHVIPQSRGGADNKNNKVGACAACNTAKAAMTPGEWAESGNRAPEALLDLYRLIGAEGIDRHFTGTVETATGARGPKLVHEPTRPKIGPRPDPKLGHDPTQNWASNQERTRKEPNDVPADESPAAIPEPGPRKLRDDWQPSDKTIERAVELGYQVDNPAQLLAEFKDYWINKGTRRKDWDRTFLNRLKAVSEQQQRGNHHGKPATSSDLLAADLQRALAL